MDNPESIIETLLQQLRDASTDRCLLWVDPAQQDVFGDHPLIEQRRIRVPIRHARFDPALAPYLVPLNTAKFSEAELFGESVRLAWQAWQIPSLFAGKGQPVCGWAICSAPADKLAAHWGKQCSLHRVGAQSMRLRFHDPSVREWLWPTLSPLQQQQLLGPAQALLSIGLQGQVLQHAQAGESAGVETSGQAETGNELKLTLSEAQWSDVNDYATVHGAWLDYCQLNEAHRQTLSRKQPNWVADILNALKQASQFGVTDLQDRRQFALHVLQFGGTFYQHPKLQAVWSRTQQGDFYGSALEDVMQESSDHLAGFLEKERSDAGN